MKLNISSTKAMCVAPGLLPAKILNASGILVVLIGTIASNLSKLTSFSFRTPRKISKGIW